MTDDSRDNPSNPHSSTSVLDLLTKARDGDDAARDRLFEKCRSYVGLVARAQVESWMRAKVDASDLVQQTLLEVHRGFDGFRGQTEAEWLGWLRMILKNNAADFVRRYHGTAKRQARREVPIRVANRDGSGDFVRDPSDPGESPSQVVMRREREMEVADAVSLLPADYQEVIMLRNLQRLPFDEVARRMGRSRPATQMLWMRALRKLEETLQAQSG
jgi:RNA polymerase sigma-70 factor (ECF subfamily)